ncbi:MAG: hypothetical protein HY981_02045 [Candidatus Magasanikbacteria bacterium]|nr:hypothetical protein [Candidatus Magasanikbacteria bacterium]
MHISFQKRIRRQTHLLLIDITTVGIFRAGILKEWKLTRAREFEYAHGSSFLAHMIRYLKAQTMKENAVQGIALVEGKGSFSAVRAAVCVLNTLQWTKGVRAAGFDCRDYVDTAHLYAAITRFFSKRPRSRVSLRPLYQGLPNITTSKKNILSRV